jgi:tRNA pseudouridine38-40 synthase
MNWKLTLSYDGSTYHGWQVQPTLPTIQGTLAAVLHHLTGETILPQGSGRTDSGVHALAQVTTFQLEAAIPPENLLRALNRALPPSIRVLSAEPAPESFHARHSALAKTYEYRIFPRRVPHISPLRHGLPQPSPETTPDLICPPFLAPYVWDCRWPLDLTLMQTAATLFLGTHNFTSFAAADPDLTQRSNTLPLPNTVISTLSGVEGPLLRPSGEIPALGDASTTTEPSTPNTVISIGAQRSGETPVLRDASSATTSGPNPTKTITQSTLTLEDGLFIYRITGSGFLHHMVRNIVGTLTEVGRGALSPNDIPKILAARNRTAAGPTAPASGLFLHTVHY